MSQPISTPIEPGLIARVSAGIRYAFTGQPNEWFGPLRGLPPVVPEAERPSVEGRQFDYAVGYNTRTTPRQGEAVTFAQMRALADGYDLMRLAIETRKDQIEACKWTIKPKDEKVAADDTCKQIQDFYSMPDKEHAWDAWLRMHVEDMLVIDAAALYPRMTRGGQLYALEPVDGATIKRVIDATGRTPLPPEPAYQQILKGVPAIDYTREELLYRPRNLRTHKVYGYSPVEQVMATVNIALRRQLHQLQFYTEGNVPEMLFGVPETWNPDQIAKFQSWWDMLIEGDTAARRHAKFVPGGVKPYPTKEAALKDQYDEWLARIICYAFSLSPTAFVAQVNRATAETSQDTADAEGLEPLKRWVKAGRDAEIARFWGRPDLEFAWVSQEKVSAKTKAEIAQIYINAKVLHPDEVRADDLGKPALTPAQKADMAPPAPVAAPGGKPGQQPGEQGDEPATKYLGAALKKKALTAAAIDRDRPRVVVRAASLAAALAAFFATEPERIAGAIDLSMTQKGDNPDPIALAAASAVGAIEWTPWETLASGVIQTELIAVATDGAFEGLFQVTPAASTDAFAVANERAIAWAQARAAELVGMKLVDGEWVTNPNTKWSITETTRQAIRADVEAAMREGLSNEALADRLRANTAFSAERAEMVARTETAFADQAGTIEGWNASGVVEGKQFLAAPDCCDVCQRLQGAKAELGKPFPGTTIQSAPVHPRCRCNVLAILLDDE